MLMLRMIERALAVRTRSALLRTVTAPTKLYAA